MNKYYLIPQPPIVKYYSFPVDNISEKSNWGRTIDLEKIDYNFKLPGNDFKIETEIYKALSEKGLTRVMPIGRFITIIGVRKDEKDASTTFFDFDIPADKKCSKKFYSTNILKI